MSDLNMWCGSGNLAADPEVRTFQSGKIKATFRIASNAVYNNSQGERIEKTNWITVIAWNKSAEFAGKFLRKGQKVMIHGELVYESWTSNDGQKQSRLIVQAEQRGIHLLPKSANPKTNTDEDRDAPAEDHDTADAISAGIASQGTNGVAQHDTNRTDDIPF